MPRPFVYIVHSLNLIPVICGFCIDAGDVQNATLWDDSPSGLGRWGDPMNDYQINTGGFKDQIRAYPFPHHIRRNYSLFPFTNSAFGPFTSDYVDFMANITLTPENVASMIDGFEGDFIGFQAYFEGLYVGRIPCDRLRTNTYLFGSRLGASRRTSFDGVGVGI